MTPFLVEWQFSRIKIDPSWCLGSGNFIIITSEIKHRNQWLEVNVYWFAQEDLNAKEVTFLVAEVDIYKLCEVARFLWRLDWAVVNSNSPQIYMLPNCNRSDFGNFDTDGLSQVMCNCLPMPEYVTNFIFFTLAPPSGQRTSSGWLTADSAFFLIYFSYRI